MSDNMKEDSSGEEIDIGDIVTGITTGLGNLQVDTRSWHSSSVTSQTLTGPSTITSITRSPGSANNPIIIEDVDRKLILEEKKNNRRQKLNDIKRKAREDILELNAHVPFECDYIANHFFSIKCSNKADSELQVDGKWYCFTHFSIIAKGNKDLGKKAEDYRKANGLRKRKRE